MFRSGKSLLLAPFFLLAASATPFTINVNFTGGLSPTQQSVFTTAANTWMSLFSGYQPGISIAALNINAAGSAIDGIGGVLGSAGPNSVTNQGGYLLATSGSMSFDSADLANMESNGTLLAVILHEMAHVMGFGTLWTSNGVDLNNSGQYTGPAALSTYKAEFSQPSATFIPVELGGSSGTANGHWNEVDGGGALTGIVSPLGDMRYELMTGWINSQYFISQTTVASFVDIGYLAASTEVPEPAPMALLSIGLIAIGVLRRRAR